MVPMRAENDAEALLMNRPIGRQVFGVVARTGASRAAVLLSQPADAFDWLSSGAKAPEDWRSPRRCRAHIRLSWFTGVHIDVHLAWRLWQDLAPCALARGKKPALAALSRVERRATSKRTNFNLSSAAFF